MSHRAHAWAIEQMALVSANAFKVLVCLADHENARTGLCFPKKELIGERTGMNAKTVQRAVAELRGKGLIETRAHRSEAGVQISQQYVLNYPGSKDALDRSGWTDVSMPDGQICPPAGGQDCPEGVDTSDPHNHGRKSGNNNKGAGGQADTIMWCEEVWATVYPHPAHRGSKAKAFQLLAKLTDEERAAFVKWCGHYRHYLSRSEFGQKAAMLTTTLNGETWREPIGKPAVEPVKGAGQGNLLDQMDALRGRR